MKLKSILYLIVGSLILSSCNDDDATPKHFVGEHFGGGVVFHTYQDDGKQHGLIVTVTDVSSGASWGTYGVDVSGAKSLWDGQSNTNAIIAAGAATEDAALLCDNLIVNEKADWYLPALDELNLLYDARFEVNKTLSEIPGAQQLRFEKYWSSTQTTPELAWYFNFDIGGTYGTYHPKNSPLYVRAVRAF